MSKELTTRGPFDSDPGVLVRWMLKSGQVVNRPIGNGDVHRTRPGIQLYVPQGGNIVELDLADVHEAGDLYVALEAHMENVADGGLLQVTLMSGEDREAMTPNTPKSWRPESPEAKDAMGEDLEFLEAMDNVLEAWMNPAPVPAFHDAVKDATRRDFPALAAALDRLAALNA